MLYFMNQLYFVLQTFLQLNFLLNNCCRNFFYNLILKNLHKPFHQFLIGFNISSIYLLNDIYKLRNYQGMPIKILNIKWFDKNVFNIMQDLPLLMYSPQLFLFILLGQNFLQNFFFFQELDFPNPIQASQSLHQN